MTKKELCSMCTEYSAEEHCDNEDSCKLISILNENKTLKNRVKELEQRVSNLTWEKYPDMMGR